MARWDEDDRFWETFAPHMFGERRWEAAAADVDGVLALAGVEPGAAVLDLPCGVGRHTLELARRGFRVTAVDRTATYLEQLRQRLTAEGLTAEVVEADMRQFRRPGSFDLALNLFTSFGYFEDPADDRAVAAGFHSSLRPGGAMVMELIGKEVLARVFQEKRWSEEPDGSLMLEESRVQPGWGWIDNRWILIRGTERVEFRVSHRLYSAVELSGLLTEVGFASVAVYGDLAGAPYDPEARRLVLVARRD
jgi:SAM-dependent methyltransferase